MSFSVISVALAGLTFVAVMLVAGNNLSASVGPAVGSRIISKRFGVLLGAVGFSAGLLVQGAGMVNSVDVLLPGATDELRAAALLVAILIFVIADVARVPMSLSMSLVGLLAGLSFAGASSSGAYVAKVAVLWFLAPLLAIGLGFGLVRVLSRRWPNNFWHRIQEYKLLLIVLSFSSAYVLGANTLGLVVATGGFELSHSSFGRGGHFRRVLSSERGRNPKSSPRVLPYALRQRDGHSRHRYDSG